MKKSPKEKIVQIEIVGTGEELYPFDLFLKFKDGDVQLYPIHKTTKGFMIDLTK